MDADSRALFLLLSLPPDRDEDVVRDVGLGVVLMILLALVVVASVVDRTVGAFRMKEGSVGFARVVYFGDRMRIGFLAFGLKRVANRGSEKLLFLMLLSGLLVVELDTSSLLNSGISSPEFMPVSIG